MARAGRTHPVTARRRTDLTVTLIAALLFARAALFVVQNWPF